MSFIAKYRGTCDECGAEVEKGQEATFRDRTDGIIIHVKCPEVVRPLAKRGVCPHCFVELPVSGVCECRE